MSATPGGLVGQIYDARLSLSHIDGALRRAEIIRDLECLDIPKSDALRLLEVGCGQGWHLEELARRGMRNLWGLDVSRGHISDAAGRLGDRYRGQVGLVHADILEWSPPPDFDMACSFLACIGAFRSSAADLRYLINMRKSLRPEGRFFLSVFIRERVPEMTGSFSVDYSGGVSLPVRSEVAFDSIKSTLNISQGDLSSTGPIVESLFVYGIDEINALLTSAGLRSVRIEFPAYAAGCAFCWASL